MPGAREDGRPSHNNRVPRDGIGHASDGDPPAKGKSRHLENNINGGKGQKAMQEKRTLVTYCKAVKSGQTFLPGLIDLSTSAK